MLGFLGFWAWMIHNDTIYLSSGAALTAKNACSEFCFHCWVPSAINHLRIDQDYSKIDQVNGFLAIAMCQSHMYGMQQNGSQPPSAKPLLDQWGSRFLPCRLLAAPALTISDVFQALHKYNVKQTCGSFETPSRPSCLKDISFQANLGLVPLPPMLAESDHDQSVNNFCCGTHKFASLRMWAFHATYITYCWT